MGKFGFIGWDWKGSMDSRELRVINAAIGEPTQIKDITDHSTDSFESVVYTADLRLDKDEWNVIRYAVLEGDETLFEHEIEGANEVFEITPEELKALGKALLVRPEPEPVDQGKPCTIMVTCFCGWTPDPEDCPMCGKTEHEAKTGHTTSVRIMEYHAGKKN
jgi:hypothetical protein